MAAPIAYAAFIRAIGPETHRIMPQAELCARCDGLGLSGTRSYIASGNLHFRSPFDAARSARIVEQAIKGFGLERPVFTRDAGALDVLIADNPFSEAPHKGAQAVSVSLFDEDHDPALVAALLAWPGPERLAVRGRTVYVHYVAGQGTSKISPPVIERRLKRVGTARNMSTLIALRGLLSSQ
ncbi:MAG: DUF1697 domain-containing protein [Hyphomicrobiales bacterium]